MTCSWALMGWCHGTHPRADPRRGGVLLSSEESKEKTYLGPSYAIKSHLDSKRSAVIKKLLLTGSGNPQEIVLIPDR